MLIIKLVNNVGYKVGSIIMLVIKLVNNVGNKVG